MVEKLNDAHLHFDMKAQDPIGDIENYLNANEISKCNLIINSNAEFGIFEKAVMQDKDFITNKYITFLLSNNDQFIDKAIEFSQNNAINFGIKIHPRLSNIKQTEISWYLEKLDQIDNDIIIVDDFMYGNNVSVELPVELTCTLASRYKEKKIVLAHAGGIKLLEHVMRTKPFKNIFYDVSLTINYLQYSSVQYDLEWLIYFGYNRVMLGSDYPDFSLKDAIICLEKIIYRNPKVEQYMPKICKENFEHIFQI